VYRTKLGDFSLLKELGGIHMETPATRYIGFAFGATALVLAAIFITLYSADYGGVKGERDRSQPVALSAFMMDEQGYLSPFTTTERVPGEEVTLAFKASHDQYGALALLFRDGRGNTSYALGSGMMEGGRERLVASSSTGIITYKIAVHNSPITVCAVLGANPGITADLVSKEMIAFGSTVSSDAACVELKVLPKASPPVGALPLNPRS